MSSSNTTLFLRHLEDETNTASMSSSSLVAMVLSNVFLFFLIFGLSATVHIRSLKQQLGNKVALLTGVGMQFVIMPLLGFAAVLILKQTDDDDGFTMAMGVTLLVVVSSPGGSYSNLWCSLFNGDLALSVAMTSVSTMLSVGLLPANLLLYSRLAYSDTDEGSNNLVASLNFGTLFISLGIVMGAIMTGLLASYMIDSPVFSTWANRGASVSGIALILVSALLSSVGTETSFWNQHWKFYAGVGLPCLIGLLLATILSRSFRLPKPECVTIAIECCYQNTGIATSVAVTMFARDPEMRAQAVAVPLFYGLIEAIVIGIFCLWAWKAGWTKAPRDEALCVVVAKSYEVDDNAMRDDDDDDDKVELQRQDDDKDDDDKAEPQHQDDDKQVKETINDSEWWQLWKKRIQVAPVLMPTVDHDSVLDGESQCEEPQQTKHD